MKLTKRLNAAISKLYQAFHSNSLNPENCKQCAVGNILDNTDMWQHLTNKHGSKQLSYIGLVNQKFGKRFNGYTPLELLNVETVFLKACGYKGLGTSRLYRPKDIKDSAILFNGMEAVISYLCALDGVENVMTISKVFKHRQLHVLQ